jgi:hypothetical protein
MSVTDIILQNVTHKSAVKSGEKLARTICFLTPQALVRYGHNFVKRDGQIRRKFERKTNPDNMLFDPTSACSLRT